MLLQLRGRHLRALSKTSEGPFVGRISDDAKQVEHLRTTDIFLARERCTHLPPGFRAYLLHDGVNCIDDAANVFALSKEMHYLAAGDVVRINPRRSWVDALYRRSSPNNSLLVTERCDNYCIMCSQPPRLEDDSWLVDELAEVVPLIAPETHEIGITGGEPALLGQRLVGLISLFKQHLPNTALHVLTNGRAFKDTSFARSLAGVCHADLMLGIPLYSDLAEEHDYVVQARGAFSETVRGILNLKRAGVRVEVRVVIHAQTYRRLANLARFITRNLLFVDHVALMGLELMGFAKTNLDALWIDPVDYQAQLLDAVTTLDAAGINVSLYNHQLCVLERSLHRFSRKSISDWKNDYVAECADCGARKQCGGFFASGTLRRSRGISAMGELACADISFR